MPTGALKLIKCVGDIIYSLSQNPSVLMKCERLGLAHTLREFLLLHDYKIQSNVLIAMGKYLVTEDAEIRRKMVYKGIL